MDGAVLHRLRKESWYGLQGLWPGIDMGWLQEVLKYIKVIKAPAHELGF